MSANAFNGSIHKNPFNFQHYYVTSVIVSSDSHSQVRPIKTDYEKGFFLQAYMSLFESSGIYFEDAGNAITKEDYASGYSLIGYDLTDDLSSSEAHMCIPKQGSLRIDLQFAKPLTESIAVIVYGEFDSLIELDKNRNVSLDYSS